MAFSASVSWYHKFPNGFIIQGGRISSLAPNTSTTVTYPLAMTTILSVQATLESDTTITGSVSMGARGISSCTLRHNASSVRDIDWLVVGYLRP